MSIKRSQNFIYFQNKATHYHNLQTAKTKVQDHLANNLRNTIDHSQHLYDRDLPYHKKYQIDYQNKNFANRLLSINTNFKKQLQQKGSYARFNKFERNFRKLNPYKDEQQRKIMEENQKIRKKIQSTRARVGNKSVWQAQYRDYDKYKKLSCRYEQNQKSKIELIIQKQPFLPDHYLKFIEQLSHSNSDKSINKMQNSRTSRNNIKKYRIEQQKMFILPSIQNQTIQKQIHNQLEKQQNQKQKPQLTS